MEQPLSAARQVHGDSWELPEVLSQVSTLRQNQGALKQQTSPWR